MPLTEDQEQQLTDLQEIAELPKLRSWQLFRKQKIEDAIQRIEHSLATVKQTSWDAYLSLWHRRETLMMLLGDLDTAVPHDIEALQKKASEQPDDRPATGALA